MPKEIYTGTYLFGDVNSNTSFGGVSSTIKLPNYEKFITLYIHDKCKSGIDIIENAATYNLSIKELEGLYLALERIINDIRKLESLSKQNLLCESAYSFTDE
ncbi:MULTISPECIES: hypothetical protein [Providencia]|uniref:Uncharacterized protein n=1 Tax=Providencia stuartii ATCC 25827 TaxID=471874 RepID=A0AA86YNX8_PROST|nr:MULTISPECIES: hypothetical protein [Providencia]SST03422.1 Uncharacterised protein [Acinetobacter baumannii]APG50966.1 hypothetical protein BGK56_08385 [Providencia stuartii]AVL39098.1 hypothetical protein CEP70_03350 [Providencia stuartii]EDU57506.1 hypothetical protein PROSTU_04751 [Providencia stuartii ATCC 25827]KSX96873.1 hypothetical protein APT95_11305 [Providencia stuartii]